MDWQSTLSSAHSAVETIEQAIAELTTYRDQATAEIAKYLRALSNLRR